jgi:antitoxin component of MazEF toxin-antitoxin module
VKKESIEFDARIPDSGELVIPTQVLERLIDRSGSRVHIRVSNSSLSAELKKRNVTEEEIEHIAQLQLEPKENVVKFLETESAMCGDSRFKRSAQRYRGRA